MNGHRFTGSCIFAYIFWDRKKQETEHSLLDPSTIMNPSGADRSQDIGLPLDAGTATAAESSSFLFHTGTSPIMTENADRQQATDPKEDEVDSDFIPPIAEIVISEPIPNSKEVEISNDSRASKTSQSNNNNNGENSDDSPISSALSTASSALHIMRRESSADNFSLLASASGTAKPSLTPQTQQANEASKKASKLRRKGFPSRRDRASAHAQTMLEDGMRTGSTSYGSLSSYNHSLIMEESWRRNHRSGSLDSTVIYGSHNPMHPVLRPHASQPQSFYPRNSSNGGGGGQSMAPTRSSPRKVGRRGSMPLHVVGKQEGLALRHSNGNAPNSTASAAHSSHRPATQPSTHSRSHGDYHPSSSHPNPTSRPASRGGHFDTSPPSSYIFSNRAGGRSTARMDPIQQQQQSLGRQALQRHHFSSSSPARTEATETNTDSHSASRGSSETPPSSQTPITENVSVKSGLTAFSASSADRRRPYDGSFHPTRGSAASNGSGRDTSESVLVPRRESRASTLVSFGTVEIRQYQRILGDNPSCSSGPALSLDWDHDDDLTSSKSVDDYEYYRGQRLDDTEMVLTRYEREELLLDLGYSRKEIAEAIRKNVNIKNRRRQTVNNLSVMPFEQAIEDAARKISRVVLRKSSSKSLYNNWRQENPTNSRQQVPIVCQEESSSSMESQSHESPIRSSLKSDASIASSSIGFRSRDSTKGAHTSTTMTTTTHSAEYSMTMTQAAASSISHDGDQEQIHIHRKPECLPRQPSTDVSTRFSEPTLSGWTTDHVSAEEPHGGHESSSPKTSDHFNSRRTGICNEIIIMEQEDTLISQ